MKIKRLFLIGIASIAAFSTLQISAAVGNPSYTVYFDNQLNDPVISLIDSANDIKGVGQLGINPLPRGVSGPYLLRQDSSNAQFDLRIVNQKTNQISKISFDADSGKSSENCLSYRTTILDYVWGNMKWYACVTAHDEKGHVADVILEEGSPNVIRITVSQ